MPDDERDVDPTTRKINQGTVMNTPFPKDVSLAEQERLMVRVDRMASAFNDYAPRAERIAVDVETLRSAGFASAFVPATPTETSAAMTMAF